ncbi:MAG: CdaR family protein [Pseudomonadota bacterium]
MPRLSDIFFKNLGLKFFALVMAVVLWFVAVGRETAEMGLQVPLEMVNIPPEMVISNAVPDGISVRIRGSVPLTRQAADRKLRFSLDLAGAKAGPNDFILVPDALALPRGLEVTRLAPNSVTVVLEGLINKTINLLPVIKGEPVAGYIIDDINLEPRQVEVRGPESVLKPLDIIWTEPVDVTKLKDSNTLTVAPVLPDVSMTLIKPTMVKISLKIGKKVVIRPFKAVPIEGVGTDFFFSTEPETVDLVLRGPVNTVTELVTGKGLSVKLDLSGLNPGKYDRPVKVDVPPDMEVVRVEPDTVKTTIFQEMLETYHEQH